MSGRVAEIGTGDDTLTALIDISARAVCASRQPLPLTAVSLPMTPAEREALEGMRIALGQSLTVTDVYWLHDGKVTLSANGVQRVPTEVAEPGDAAADVAEENRWNRVRAALPSHRRPPIPAGTVLKDITGVLGRDDRGRQLALEPGLTVQPPRPEPDQPPVAAPAPGSLRVVSANLLNFFNGDGRGGGFPTERGARSPRNFAAQKERLRAMFGQIRPDLLGVQELENDGFGKDSAAESLRRLLESAGGEPWAVANPGSGHIGSDVITVGLFYRPDVLEAIGPARVLNGTPFEGLSRHPLAQVFRVRDSGTLVLVAVNHLKSKGRCPENGANADRGDGQGCWNAARTEAVQSLLPWLDGLAREHAAAGTLVLGDMNAWRREDPIAAYRSAGLIDAVEAVADLPQYSYLYFGETGTLDYVFATPALAQHAVAAMIWHANAPWPRRMRLPRPWLRASDHDPVIVDFDFSQSATSD